MMIGDIFWIDFSTNSVGHEFKGRRPAIIIQSNSQIGKANTVTVMPLTGNLKNRLTDDIMVIKDSKNKLLVDSIIKVYDIMSFDKRRLIKKIGEVDNEVLGQIKNYLKKHFDL